MTKYTVKEVVENRICFLTPTIDNWNRLLKAVRVLYPDT